VNGQTGIILYLDGQVDQVWAVETNDDRVSAIRIVRNPEKLNAMEHPAPLE
jgi:hypothetical protein